MKSVKFSEYKLTNREEVWNLSLAHYNYVGLQSRARVAEGKIVEPNALTLFHEGRARAITQNQPLWRGGALK
jgi:hypothetical protein